MTKAGLGETLAGDTQLPRPGQWGHAATLPRCLCSGGSDPVGKLPLLQAGPGYTVIHSNMQSVNSVPSTPPAAAVSPPWSSADQWEVSPPSRPMGACHQALGQWEVSQCRDVPELRTNGRPRQHPWCSTHDQPAASTSHLQIWRNTETSRQTGSARPELN